MDLERVKEFCESHFVEEEDKRTLGCQSCPLGGRPLKECRAGRPWSWSVEEIERAVESRR
jgi:hypothetical protein